MGKIIRLTESQLTSIVKKVIKENEGELEINAATQTFNRMTGENISTEESKEIACGVGVENPDLSQVPQNLQGEAKTKIQQIKEKAKTTSLEELIRALRELRQQRRQMRQQRDTNEQMAVRTGMTTILGVSISLELLSIIVVVLLTVLFHYIMKRIFDKQGGMEASSCKAYGFQRHPTLKTTAKNYYGSGMKKVMSGRMANVNKMGGRGRRK